MLRKEELESEISICEDQLSRINYLLEGKEMKYEAIIKDLPDYIVYYKEGIIKKIKPKQMLEPKAYNTPAIIHFFISLFLCGPITCDKRE